MDVSKSALRDLGAQLQQLRNGARLSLRDLEQRVTFSNAKISLIENGHRLASAEDIDELLTALDADSETRERILGLRIAAIDTPGEIAPGPTSIGPMLTQLIDYEERATRIVNWATMLMPGLLQTEGYTRAVMGDVSNAEVRVKLRSGRQQILTRRRNAVELLAILDSEVLVRPVAPIDVMIDQLHFLLDMAERPNITLRVVSSTEPGYHQGLAGTFQLIEFPTAKTIVHAEHARTSMFLWKEEEVAGFYEALEMIEKKAMTPDHSAGVIRDIVNGMETT